MWRFCDLHNHTFPNESCTDAWDAEAFVRSCVAVGLDVVAITDHDILERYDEIADAAGEDPVVIPGVELSTDRGHVLLVSPGDGGVDVIREFITRVGARPGNQIDLLRMFDALGEDSSAGGPFAALTVAIGAHVDMDGQLLGSPNALSIERQLAYGARLNALEVVRNEVLEEWLQGGVKQGLRLPLLRGSDTHDPSQRRDIGTWLYLPEVSAPAVQHALALPEASIRYDGPPRVSSYRIEELEFSDGLHAGHVFRFCERTNALIGPPNSGKSLVVDALKAAFSIACDIDEVEDVTARRVAKCLPPGTVITVRVASEDGPLTLVRTVGGADQPTPPFRPIVFSQTELVRRAHEPRPSIRLLDVHCVGADEKTEELKELEQQVVGMFLGLVAQGAENRRHSEVLGNSEDGLAATKRRLEELVGNFGERRQLPWVCALGMGCSPDAVASRP